MMQTLVFLSCLVLSGLSVDVLRLPPKMTRQPKEEQVFELNAKGLEMACEAEGVPDVEYTWKKNNIDLGMNDENIEEDPNSGSFTFEEVVSLNAGYYQCFAENQYGKAMSRVASLQRAVLGNFPTQSEPEGKEVNQGDKLQLLCNAPKSFPVPTYSWSIIDSMQDKSPTTLTESKRLMSDLKGNLHFMNVEQGDDLGGRIYRCQVYNAILKTTKGGNEQQVIVNSMTPASTKPHLEFGPDQSMVALAGTDMTVQCIYSGFPTPNVQFTRKVGNMPYNRYTTSKYNTVMTIRDVEESDEGAYICSGDNNMGRTDWEFIVDVEVKPVFETVSARPHDMNKTEGESASFLCNAKAEPTAQVQWFKNGEMIDSASPGPRMKVEDDGRKLTIVDICKTCSGGGTDLMVIQCNASNVHGYAFAQGYLNVLLKTEFVEIPKDVNMLNWEEEVFFPCEATSDDSTPIDTTWYFNDVEIDPNNEAYDILPGGLLVDAVKLANEDKEKVAGKYTCSANNGLSSVNAHAHLTLPKDPARNDTVTGGAVIVEGGVNWVLIVVIIVVVLLLLLLLLLVCCLCMQRNKGDEYPVDEKEKKAGLNPEKELADSGYHDYQRPEGQPFKGSRASLTSTIKLNDSDDEESLAEYGEPDTGKFNEDGSFLGEYTEKRRPRGGDSIV